MCNGSQNARGVPNIVDRTGERILAPGTASFARLVTKYIYVDKTMLIDDVVRHGDVTLFCRPRRFGKSCVMSMLRYYLEAPVEGWIPNRAGLFDGLAVEGASARTTAERFRHPVIRLSLGRCAGGSFEATVALIAEVVAEEYTRHDYLLESKALRPYLRDRYMRLASGEPKTEGELVSSLAWLSILLHDHHEADVVILIDEYDAPIVDGHLNGYRARILSFYRSWLTDAIKDNDDLLLSALTGVLRVSQESIFSELNNVEVNTMLDGEYGEAFGFTPDEVAALADYVGRGELTDQMRTWYDGYRSGGTDVYNPWSVIKCLKKGRAQAYWTNTSMNGIVRELVRRADEPTSLDLARVASGSTVEKALDMQTVFDDLAKNPGAVWPQLYQTGYVTTDDTGGANMRRRPRRLRLPNLEVAELFGDELFGRAQAFAGSTDNLCALHTALRGTDEDALERALRQIMLDSPSFHDLASEGQCHMLLMGLLYGMDGYRSPTSNREAGDGRADVLLEPEPTRALELPAVVVEVKRPRDDRRRDLEPDALKAHARDVALDQAVRNEYAHGMRGRGLVLWGVSFAGKHVACACKERRC